MKTKKWSLWRLGAAGLGILCLLVLCLLGVREVQLDTLQQEALVELEERVGEYDPQTIVLSGTNAGRARNLASLLGAELRITADGSFATLTLPAGTDIQAVYANKAYRELIPELSADYRAQISDWEEEEAAQVQSRGHQHERPYYPVSDPGFAYQGWMDYLNLKDVWYSYQGSGTLVAVIDTGIDTDHPEFAGRISEYSYNATEDRVVRDYGLSIIEDTNGHGTAVAGVIGAAMDGSGTVGVAPGVELLIIKAECDDSGNFLRTSDLVFGLYYAIERGADVVNMSFGTSSNVFEDAARLAWDSNVLCVASAGNSGTTTLNYPAADPLVLGVGALTENSWELAEYSNYGDNVDLVAPGAVYTTDRNGGYISRTGTSFAAPAVSGILALRLTGYGYISPEAVWEDLFASCYDLGSLGADWLYGYGAVDAHALIQEERGTVTFNMQTDELGDLEQVFVRNHTLQAIPEPERLYAVFDGWYYDAQCTEEYQWYADVFTSDLTLYAKWANEDDSVPYTYVTLEDGTVEIRSYTGHRRYITIPDTIDGKTVSAIGDQAFRGENRLREVHLPKNLRIIGNMAFDGCTSLTQLRIPDTVTSIGAAAFQDNTRLSTVAFGSGSALTEIGDYAFAGCASLERFELPARVEHMDGTALFGTVSLEAIGVRSGNQHFAARDGVLFDKSGAVLVAYPAGKYGSYQVPDTVRTIGVSAFGYTKAPTVDLNRVQLLEAGAFANGSLETLVIPDSVTEMGEKVFAGNARLRQVVLGQGLRFVSGWAFYRCTALEQVEIPAAITQIGEVAFAECAALKSVNFAQDSALAYIGRNAFGQTGLESIELPASLAVIDSAAFRGDVMLSSVTFEAGSVLTGIGSYAFECTPKLKTIVLPDGLATLGDYVFLDSGLTEVTVPSGVSAMGDGVFAACHDLTEIRVATDNKHYVGVNGAVYTADKTTLVHYPAGNPETYFFVPETVTAIADAAFYGNWNLTGVNIPGSVKTLGEYAFYDCRKVTGYELCQGLEEIGSYAFSRNTELGWMDIPASVRQINRFAFAEDRALLSVSIPDNTAMTRLGYAAFANSGLSEFRVPANVTTMAQGVFENCPNMYRVTFGAGSKLDIISAYTFDGCGNLTEIIFEPGSALTTIAAHGFEGMNKLQRVDFGDAKLTEIGNYAFRFCESLQELKVSETLVDIGRFAFYGCALLEELRLPVGLEHIGSYAFHGADKLNLYFDSDFLPLYLDENWDEGLKGYHVGVSQIVSDGDWKYAILNSGNVSIVEYLGHATELDLTGLNLGGSIVGIGGHAFAGSNVTEVVLPDSLTTIQAHAFAGSALSRVNIPANVVFIGRSAFENTPLCALTFAPGSSLRVLEQDAFAGTKSLTEVTLPKSLTVLGNRAFLESGVKSVTFEQGIQLETIPAETFAGTELTTVTIPDSVKLIDDGAFRDCRNLTALTLGAGEDLYIGSNAFYNTALAAVHIPANVTYIGEYAFVGLEKLEGFTVSADNPWYKAEDGLLMSKDGRKLIAVPAGRTGSLSVPKSVEVIGFGAFENSRLSSVSLPADGNILTLGYRAFFGAKNLRQITVPASVVSIDYYAFATCENLEKVTFAEGSRLTGVYEGAFYGCTALTDIVLPDTIVEISDFAFYGCAALDHIPVSESSVLKGIYDYAFAYTGITELEIPDTVIDIGEYAFMGIRAKHITVPDASKKELTIGLGAFADCGELEEITLPFIGATYDDPVITWAGYIFGAGSLQANAHYVPENLKTVTVTEGITQVPEWAFYQLENLERINLPHSIITVNRQAFDGTSAIYELTNDIQFPRIEEEPYYYNNTFGTGLSGTVRIADGVKTIPGYVFGWTNLTEVILPDSVTVIEENAFSYAERLQKINIPDGVTHIGAWAFYNTDLKSVVIPDGVCEINDYAFGGCSRMEDLTIGSKVTRIGRGAFTGCALLKSIELPDSVVSVDDYAFDGCDSLMELTLGKNLTELSSEAMPYIMNLQVIHNRSNLVLIPGSDAYGDMTRNVKVVYNADGSAAYLDEASGFALVDTADGFRFTYEYGGYTLVDYMGDEETVTLPLTVNGSEYSIWSLNGIKHLIIPEGFTHIGDNAFVGPAQYGSGNSVLESVVIPDTVTYIGSNAFTHCDQLRSVTIPDSVTEIGPFAFSFCSSLESVVLPEGIQQLNMGAFMHCTSLTEIVIPDSVQYVYGDVFYDCTSLSYAYIPARVEMIESTAFAGCTKLTHLDIAPGNVQFREENGILYNREMTELFYVYPTVSGEVRLPDTLVSLPNYAFNGRTGITSVVIPEGITEIPGAAFMGCTALTSVTVPSTVTTIGWEAFRDCTALEELVLPQGMEQISDYAFVNCAALEKINLPDTLTYLGSCAFEKCVSLKEIELPDSLTTIGGRTFSECTALIRATLPEHITAIPGDMFNRCYSLKDVRIPDSVTEIGDGAFYYCSGLETVHIPEGVTRIPANAFGWCTGLRNVVIPDSVTAIGDYAFYNCRALSEIVVPDSVTELGEEVFHMCHGLQKATIGNGVTRIPRQTFTQCYALVELTLGTGITEFDSEYTCECGNLRVIHNNSSLDLTPGSEEFGGIALNAKKIVNADGSVEYASGYAGYELLDTPEGYRFALEEGEYVLLGYLGTEETLTLPTTFNGEPYRIASMGGMTHVTVPRGVKTIASGAAYGNGTIKSLVVEGDTSIGSQAFDMCQNLERISLGKGTWIDGSAFGFTQSLREVYLDPDIAYLGGAVFQYSLVMDLEEFWRDGCLYIGNHLVWVNEDVEFLDWDFGGLMDDWAMSQAYSLKQATAGGNREAVFAMLTNLETMILVDDSMESVYSYFGWGSVPQTLKNVVIQEGLDIRSNRAFEEIYDVTVFVEDLWIDSGAVWDVSFPGWNNNNRVYYGDEWSTVCFYDVEGNLMSREFVLNHQVVRQPYYAIAGDERYEYTLVGWDIDGDGVADQIPATTTVDIHAYPVVARTDRKYTVTFYDKDGQTPIYVQQVTWGQTAVQPQDPVKPGYTFAGWSADVENMTVTDHVAVYSQWEHTGNGHTYDEGRYEPPTCTEPGGIRHTCTACGEWYLATYEAPAGHSYTSVTVPGCEEQGYDLHTCHCGESYRDNFTEAQGHSYSDWVRTKAPSCTATGSEARSCSHCGHKQTQTVPMLPHENQATEVREATCTEPGSITYRCGNCDATTTAALPEVPHHYVRKNVPKETLEKLIENLLDMLWGHDGETGYYFVCADCGKICTVEESGSVQSSTEDAGCSHTHGEWTVAVEETADHPGVMWRLCGLCGKALEARTYSGVPCVHQWGPWNTVQNPTREEPGQRMRTCVLCGAVQTEEIPMLDFLYGDANSDGKVNGKDLILLRQSLAGWDVTLDKAAADCNGDGTVNGKDLILLRQYLAGWAVELGPK